MMTRCATWAGSTSIGTLVVFFVALQGCKPKTAADLSSFEPFVLLDAGEEPRSPLRYEVEAGTTTRSTVSFEVTGQKPEDSNFSLSGLRSMRFDSVLGPAERNEDRIRFEARVENVQGTASRGANAKRSAEIDEATRLLEGAGGIFEVDDRGRLRRSQANERASRVPVRLLWAILNTRQTLGRIPLPSEPIGLGARWQTRGMAAIYGLTMEQQANFTLVERSGDQAVIEVEFEQSADRKTVQIPGQPETIEVDRVRTTASGRIRFDAKALASDADATGRAVSELVIVRDGEREPLLVDEAFRIVIRNQTSVATSPNEPR